MPAPGKRWRHIICNTRRSWLPGDPRGFRSRNHRIHSSGDYHHPPPAGEHAGLRTFHGNDDSSLISIATELRPVVGQAVIENLRERGHRVAALSVSALHMHLIVELPDTEREMTRIIGWCKWHATRVMQHGSDSPLWTEGFTKKPIDTPEHLRAAIKYVRAQGGGAWCWSATPGRRASGN